MIRISLCMIVKNEAAVLKRCLDSVHGVMDEIIIVDTGSTDDTKAIAALYADRLIDFEWTDDFAAARNASFDQAAMDYIFWMDADDVLQESDRRELIQLKDTLTADVDVVSMPYILERDEAGQTVCSIRRDRLVRRERKFRWVGPVHEYLVVAGRQLRSRAAVTHLPVRHHGERNLGIYTALMKAGRVFTPHDWFYFANEWYDHGDYVQAIEYYLQFFASLDANSAQSEDAIAVCARLADSYAAVGDGERAVTWALKSFAYDTPRAEFCCRLGYAFLQRQQWRQAAFWYETATKLEPLESAELRCGLIDHPCWTWLPHLQLCVCFDRLGDRQLAWEHNEIARQYRPSDPAILRNKAYLEACLRLTAASTTHPFTNPFS